MTLKWFWLHCFKNRGSYGGSCKAADGGAQCNDDVFAIEQSMHENRLGQITFSIWMTNSAGLLNCASCNRKTMSRSLGFNQGLLAVFGDFWLLFVLPQDSRRLHHNGGGAAAAQTWTVHNESFWEFLSDFGWVLNTHNASNKKSFHSFEALVLIKAMLRNYSL